MERRFELIGEMTPAIWIHSVAAIAALLLGAFILWRRKGTTWHRMGGRVWVALMLVVALSSFFISEIRQVGPFSWIHLLSLYTLGSLAVGLGVLFRKRLAPVERIAIHRATMQNLYAGALLIAGGFTFLPDRLIGRLTFGESYPLINVAIAVAMVLAGVWLIVQANRGRVVGRPPLQAEARCR